VTPNPILPSLVAEGATFSIVRHRGWADDKVMQNPNNAKDGTPFEAGTTVRLGSTLLRVGFFSVPGGEDFFFFVGGQPRFWIRAAIFRQ